MQHCLNAHKNVQRSYFLRLQWASEPGRGQVRRLPWKMPLPAEEQPCLRPTRTHHPTAAPKASRSRSSRDHSEPPHRIQRESSLPFASSRFWHFGDRFPFLNSIIKSPCLLATKLCSWTTNVGMSGKPVRLTQRRWENSRTQGLRRSGPNLNLPLPTPNWPMVGRGLWVELLPERERYLSRSFQKVTPRHRPPSTHLTSKSLARISSQRVLPPATVWYWVRATSLLKA